VKFMMLLKADRNTEAGKMPGEDIIIAMGKYNEELIRAGVLLAGEGLQPSSKGARVRFAGGKTTVIDGPFSETKELIAGFWMIQVKSKEEAIEWAKRVPFDPNGASALEGGVGEIELRQVFEEADFSPELYPSEEAQATLEAEKEFRQRANTENIDMISHIHATTVVVSDQEKALDFYVGKLGWDKTDDAPMGPSMRWLTVAPKGAATNISLALPSWFTQKPSLEMGINTCIAFGTRDMKATYAELSKRGVKFKGEPEMMPWGKLGCWFVDPDRNEFFIAET